MHAVDGILHARIAHAGPFALALHGAIMTQGRALCTAPWSGGSADGTDAERPEWMPRAKYKLSPI